ncbi:hypothetical protein ACFC1B_06960 [Streptomyces xiamenensis]|uniref:hypothetical protein n=1 Tax=Streptomyces xiamenensis TaxID=408015 RepID=UPI0035DAE595
MPDQLAHRTDPQMVTSPAHHALATAGLPPQALLSVSHLGAQRYEARFDSREAARICDRAWTAAGYRVRPTPRTILDAAREATGSQRPGAIRIQVETPIRLPHGPDRPTRLNDTQLRELRERARREAGPFVDPAIVRTGRSWHSRCWAEAIVGFEVTKLDWPTLYLLHIAMEAEPSPPAASGLTTTPHDKATSSEQGDRTTRYASQDADEARRWARAAAACAVPIEVRPNAKGPGRARGGRNIGPLRHVTPLIAAVSDRRTHPAGRALCEDTRERQLGDPVSEHATCSSCVTYVPLIRPERTPA